MKDTKTPAQMFAESAALPSAEELGEIAKLATEIDDINHRLETLAESEAALKTRLKKISEEMMPEIFAKFNLSEIVTGNGLKVAVKPFYSGSIANPAAYDWLVKNGHGGIIKSEVRIPFPKSEIEKANKLVDKLVKLGFSTALFDQSVHAQTMKAFVRERYEAGHELPQDLFKVYVGKTTKVTAK